MERRDLMKKKLNRVLSCLVIGGLLLASGSAVLAASDTETQSAAPAVRASGPRGAGMEDNLKEVLDSLVSSSSITQEQADQLLALQAERQAQMKSQWEKIKDLTPEERKSMDSEKPTNRSSIFSDAVEQGIITEAERETICNALAEARQEQRQAELQERFAELVSQGIISQEQADTIIVQIQKAAAVQQAELEKVKDMSAEERQQYLQSKGEKANLLDDLIADGTLTQAQADDVAKLMGGGFHKSPPSQRTE